MFARIIFLTIVSLQLSACIATPRLFSNVVSDYEPPAKEPPKAQAPAQPKIIIINEQLREEIRRQVQEEIKHQNTPK